MKNVRNKIVLTVLILSMIALIFSGCGGGGGGGGGGNPVIPPPEDEPIEAIIPETTKVTEEETIQEIASVAEDQSTIVFDKSTSQLENLALGDIIAMGVTENTPEGLLRKVTNITKGGKDGSQVIVETEFATLEEAIEQGEFCFNEALKAKDAKEPVCYVKGVEFIRDRSTIRDSKIQLLEFNYNINSIIYDGDNNPNTKEDNINLSGQISFDYNLLFSGKIKFFHNLKELNFQNIVEIEKNLGVTVGSSVELFSYEKELWTHSLGTKLIWVGYLPIVLSPKITIIANVNGEISAKVTAEVTDKDTYTAGIKFDNGSWQPISSHENSFSPPSVSLSAGGAVTFGVGPNLECKVDGVVGPYCETTLYGKAIADIYDNPWWKLYVGIIAKAGVQIEIFSKVLASAELTILDLQKIIKQADGPFGGTNHPPVISDLTADSPSIDINQTTTITCTASDEDVGDTLYYTWTKTGGIFEGSTSGSSVTWKAPSTKGNYTVECEVSDGEASDSKQVIISVGDVNHAPVITSTPVTSATKDEPYSYDLNATDSDGDTLTCSLTTSPAGMSINSSSGMINWTPTSPGYFNVTVRVFDGELSATQSYTIVVSDFNHPPVISDLSADPPSVNVDKPTTVTCDASDPDGDPLTYDWTVNAGSFEGDTSGPSVTWRAPSTADIYIVVSCEVSDGKGGEDTETRNIVVTESDETKIKNVINGFFQAISDQDWSEARSYCVYGTSIYNILEELPLIYDYINFEIDNSNIEQVEIQGILANVYWTGYISITLDEYVESGFFEDVLSLRKTENRWKIYESSLTNYW